MRKLRQKFGFKIGDICKHSSTYYEATHSKRGIGRRFEVIGFKQNGMHDESIHVKRLDLASGRIEWYHYTLMQKLRAGERY